ncbi:transposase [Leptospira interrogans serovar Pyrogenes str. 200701872]|uniref:Transposase n=1 Tax=Leptospira interrogans serovar Pyrogenes str. 200701872 TaxID=1193029 RepID=M6ZFR9_LEPIR|nr:transposase [Leptospira interrogans serovar Pyrogenes str. 200701872]
MLVYHNSGLLRPSAPLKTLGERNEKSRNQIRRNRLWKKTLEVIRIGDNSLHQRQQFSTTEIGISKLINWLNPNDVVGLEAGSQSFRIAKSILNKGIQVIVLNPGDLATIYQSLKKTDKEDSLKIARLTQRFPIEELPVVPIPNDEEEDNRRLCTEQENWTRQLTQSKNRLHSLFTQAGLTHITKKHLRTKANREISVALLPSRYQKEAERILKVLDLVEQNLKLIEEEIKEALKKIRLMLKRLCQCLGSV